MKNCIPFFALVKKSSIFHCFHELYPLTNFQHQPSNNYIEKSPGNSSYPLCVSRSMITRQLWDKNTKHRLQYQYSRWQKHSATILHRKKWNRKPHSHHLIPQSRMKPYKGQKKISHPWFGGERGLNFLSVIFVHDCTYELLIWGRSEVRTFPQEWPQPSLRHLLGPTAEVYKRYFFVHHCTEALFL